MSYLIHSLAWSAVWGLSSAAAVNAFIDYRRNKDREEHRGR